MTFSPDVQVMLAPARAYEEALGRPAGSGWKALRRPALVALVLGTSTAFSSTGHLTVGLLVSGTLCWSFVPLVQIATAAAILRGRRSAAMTFPRRLDLWFMGHLPLSLWILAAGSIVGSVPPHLFPERLILATAPIAIVWTNIISAAFCRVVLGDPPPRARARLAVHQVLTWTIVLLYFSWAVALQDRIAEVIARLI